MLSGVYGPNTKGKIFLIRNQQPELFLTFQLNPTEIAESRGVSWAFSEGQGQILPHAQYGRAENTEISFTLKMFNHKGISKGLSKLRKLTLPRDLGRMPYYDQASPYHYVLHLGEYGQFIGVFQSVSILVKSYHRDTLLPVDLEADITFIQSSYNLVNDITVLEELVKYDNESVDLSLPATTVGE
jgi:hypothetical protein